jgi:Predicted AAA-ATPase
MRLTFVYSNVIRMSLDSIRHEGGLSDALKDALHDIAETFGITLKKQLAGPLFKELIDKVVRKTGKQVVILIDEYDRPIIDYIDPYNLEMANQQRDILKGFFSILKGASKDIRFLLITGVSKFARVSIFSDLNHLIDLTLHEKYAALCGYTQAELEHYFDPCLNARKNEILVQWPQLGRQDLCL